MLRDSRIRFGLSLIKGPVHSYTKFFSSEEAEDPQVLQAIIDQEYHYSYKVESEDKETEDFVLDTLTHFWNDGALKAMLAVEWGYSPSQVIYRRDSKGRIAYHGLLSYSIHAAKPVSRNLELIGIYLKKENKFLPLPKAFVHVHQREHNRFTGLSRLIGAHIPWHETWTMGGARDIRSMWFFKNAYDSGTMYVPPGSTTDEQGNVFSNVELATKIMESVQTGSYRILPSEPGGGNKNERKWEYESPRSNTTPQGMIEYIDALRTEVLEGLGIPPEVIENGDSGGMGSATGRKVPYLAFISSLAPIPIELINDVEHQIIRPLLRINKMNEDFKIRRIIPKSMMAQPDAAGVAEGYDSADPNEP